MYVLQFPVTHVAYGYRTNPVVRKHTVVQYVAKSKITWGLSLRYFLWVDGWVDGWMAINIKLDHQKSPSPDAMEMLWRFYGEYTQIF